MCFRSCLSSGPTCKTPEGVNTPYSERFGPVPRCSLFRGFTVFRLQMSFEKIRIIGNDKKARRSAGTEWKIFRAHNQKTLRLLKGH